MPSAPIGPQALDVSRVYELDLADGSAVSLAGRGLFTGTETFSATLSEGQGLAPLATLSAAWIDFANARLGLTVAKAAIAGLVPGYYAARVIINPGVDDVEAFSGTLRLTAPTAGSGVAPLAYCTLADLVREAPWIEEAEDLGPGLAAGVRLNFLDARLRGTERLKAVVMARALDVLDDQARRHGPVLWVDPIVPVAGYDAGPGWGNSILPDTTIQTQLIQIRGYLDAGLLMLDAAIDGGIARRIASLYALEFALWHLPGGLGKDGFSFPALAREFRREAIRLTCGWTARIDTNADGVADLELTP